MMERMITERVWCCVCNGSGKLPKLFFWKRECHACKGEGERPIIMDARFPEHIKQRLRAEATFRFNAYAAVGGRDRDAGGLGNLFGNNIL